MSSGSWTVNLNQYNYASRNWSGFNGRRTENPYLGRHTYSFGLPSDCYQLIGGAWVFQGRSYLFDPPMFDTNQQLRAFSNEELNAYTKLAEAARGMHSFDGSVFLGELRESCETIENRATRVLTAFRDFRRGNIGVGLRELFGTSQHKKHRAPKNLSEKDIANLWLELQYGWLPLLNDVDEACKALDSIRRKQGVVLRTSSSTKTTEPCGPGVSTKTNTVKLKMLLQSDISAAQQYGVASPLTVAWELLPYSFVVDWFVPIGAYLSNLSFFGGLSARVVRTRFRKVEYDISWPVRTYGILQYRNGRNRFWTIELARDVLAAPDVPLPTPKSLEKALSLGHLKNAAALITSQVSACREARR